MLKKIITISSVFFYIVPLLAQSPKQELTNALESISNRSSIAGFGVAIFSKDTLLYSKGFGVASHQDNSKYTVKTRQKIASISKLLLGVSLLKAQELGILEMDDNVNDYLPFSIVNPYFPKENITIRNLATHTSGLAKIPKYDLKALYAPIKIPKIKREMPFGIRKLVYNKTIKTINSNKEYHLEDFLTNLYSSNGIWYHKRNFRKVKPGIRTEYSNSGASLLALIIEKASGITYQDFVRRYITTPLQLKNSKFDFEDLSTINESSTYYHAGIVIPNNYRLLLYPAGGFESSIEDFSNFMISIISKTSILSKASVKEMITPQFGQEYGILWEVHPDGKVGHTGDILGATTYAFYDLKKDMGYLLFCNTAGSETINEETHEIMNVLKSHFNEFETYHD